MTMEVVDKLTVREIAKRCKDGPQSDGDNLNDFIAEQFTSMKNT